MRALAAQGLPAQSKTKNQTRNTLKKIFKTLNYLLKNKKSVGIIVNPNSGKDIRRLVSNAFVVPQQYKSNELLKLYEGLANQGVKKVFVMPDFSLSLIHI